VFNETNEWDCNIFERFCSLSEFY